jgi:hypothetical protein
MHPSELQFLTCHEHHRMLLNEQATLIRLCFSDELSLSRQNELSIILTHT